MYQSIVYFDVRYAIRAHDWIIEQTGGWEGIKDLGQLESVLHHIKNDEYYTTFEDKLCHLVFSVIKLHMFNDGNKRSSIVLGTYFLKINGYDHCIESFVINLENIVVWVAEGKIDKQLLSRIISSTIYDDEYPESLKIALIETLET